jgi:hypothetical protein
MANQSLITFFIVFAVMSATLFFQQMEVLNHLESRPIINKKQADRSMDDLEKSETEYKQAVKRKNTSDFFRGSVNFFLSPVRSIVDLFLDNVTKIEDEANTTIKAASRVIELQNIALKEARNIQQLQIQQAVSLRNIGLLMCLFSVGSVLFTRAPRLEKMQEVLLSAEHPVALKKAFWLLILGGLASSIPEFDGFIFKLALPSILIAFFIVNKQLHPQQTTWQKRGLLIFLYSVLIGTVIIIFDNWLVGFVLFAVSGFLLGLFIASSIQYASISLTTRQFFLVALMFAVARLIAALSAAAAGPELIVLEGLVGITGLLWLIQIHSPRVRLVKFDILLGWFTLYSLIAFVTGNYFQAGFMQLFACNLVISIVGGGLLTYYLSKARLRGHEFIYHLGQEKEPLTLVRDK